MNRLQAQESSLPASARPVPADLSEDIRDGEREDAVLCYHQGSTYYVKQPHPTSGSINPLFQSITPGSSGHMNAFELRLYNNFPGNLRHEGLIQLTVHRRAGLMPGVFEQMAVFSTDTVDTGVLRIPLSMPFEFAQGEQFFLGMTYLPAASLDTIAYVTAGLGSYTGHSFFLQNGQVVWWGAPDGTLFGDMHFCADVWLDTQQAYLQFPWNRLDLGRGRTGQSLGIVLPVLNQGTAPLTVSSTVSGDGWSARLAGPESLMPPDTLFLSVNWVCPPAESTGTGALTLSTNATNNPVRTIPLRAASSTADMLLADWDEWPTGVEQLVDSSDEDHTWRRVQGLNRPRTFMGHDSPLQGQTCRDVLFLHRLRLQEDATLQLRWGQYRRHSSGTREHAFVWRLAGTSEWQVTEHNLARDPWLGPADEWWTTPWLEWDVPAGGEFDVGLLYGGEGAYDRWYVDDLELQVEGSLAAPEVRVSLCAGFLKLEWEPIPGATRYRVDRVDCQPRQLLGWTADTQWSLCTEQRRGAGSYRVSAWNNRPAVAED